MIEIFGVEPSPFVRKVLMALNLKGLDYQLVPTQPGRMDDTYTAIHPMRKIPALRDGDFVLPDSSAILTYLDGLRPDPALYPAQPRDRAFAVWLEEFADTRIADKVFGGIYFPQVLAPTYLGRAVDEAAVSRTVREDLPPIWRYLEGHLAHPSGPAVGSQFSVADLAMASVFVSMHHAGQQVCGSAFPKTSAYATYLLNQSFVIRQIEADQVAFAAARAAA